MSFRKKAMIPEGNSDPASGLKCTGSGMGKYIEFSHYVYIFKYNLELHKIMY
jgi:hypothetical protein